MRIKKKEKESGQFSKPPNTNLILPHPTLNIKRRVNKTFVFILHHIKISFSYPSTHL
jgi:hypothetical protein